jgi:hypothetical protein
MAGSSASGRQERALGQRLLLEPLGVTILDDLFGFFRVIGSTGSVYTVTISNDTACTCPDHTQRKMPCKHIYFVLAKCLKAENWKKGTDFSDDDVRSMLAKVPVNTDELVKELENKAALRQRRTFEDPCPICLEDFVPEKERIIFCGKSCGYNFHELCYARCKIKTCPCCRSQMM